MDLVALGNYSGNATKLGSDATMALIAGADSGIRKGDLASLKGKKIAASFGTINHLYVLALLEKGGLTPNDVTLVNTPPPDMTVALLSKASTRSPAGTPGRSSPSRTCPGGRGHPRRGRDLLPGLQRRHARVGGEERRDHRKVPRRRLRGRQLDARQPEAGGAGGDPLDPGPQGGRRGSRDAVQHPAGRPAPVGQQLSGAMVAQDRLHRLGFLKSTFDVNKHIEPKHMLKVMKEKPQLFADLPPIPENMAIGPGLHVSALTIHQAVDEPDLTQHVP
jgi:hypothetical protein